MKKCPKCGCEKFVITAHVTQEWIVDANGSYIETIDDCVDVTHYADNDDIWQCFDCYHEAPGRDFEI